MVGNIDISNQSAALSHPIGFCAKCVEVARMLWRDKFALVSAAFLILVVFCAIFGPYLLGDQALAINLRGRNAQPFSLDRGWLYVLGADNLGRSLLARLIIGARYTIAIAGAAVVCSLIFGAILGLIAGYRGGWISGLIMRSVDIVMSFPSLLLALIVLYVLKPSLGNVVLVLAISRMAIYLRTCRAEVLEVRERQFVVAAQVLGASHSRVVFRHIFPTVFPTLLTIATLEFSAVMLAESSLSFLGLGVQAPAVTWGLMVAEGRAYLANAWWLSFWPGLAISLTAVAANLLANWLRTATDPSQRWRLEGIKG